VVHERPAPQSRLRAPGRNILAQGGSPGSDTLTPPSAPLSRRPAARRLWAAGRAGEWQGVRKVASNPRLAPWAKLAEYTDPLHNPMIPHVIVLEPGLVIYRVYNGYWFFGRPTVEDLRQDLRAVLKKCRPDWDITTPEMKAAWQQGRKELFYPYGKTYVQTLGEQD